MKKTIFGVIAMVLVLPCLFAVDGVVLINQSTVMASGGFPYTISQPGSYKLSGNLIVPNGDTTAIEIAHDSVTIDLSGFSIIGPANCTLNSAGLLCTGFGSLQGDGIRTKGFGSPNPESHINITIRNGNIQGMGGRGIGLAGDSILVEYMHLRSNARLGIDVETGAADQNNIIIQHNNVQLNGNAGIASSGGMIADNVVSQSEVNGIFISGNGIVARNLLVNNHSFAMSLHPGAGYLGNVMVGNGGTVLGGAMNLGQNKCESSVCPNAQF